MKKSEFLKIYNSIIKENFENYQQFDGYSFTEEQKQKLYTWIKDYLEKGWYECDNTFRLNGPDFLVIDNEFDNNIFEIKLEFQQWVPDEGIGWTIIDNIGKFTDINEAVTTIILKLDPKNFTPYKDLINQYLVQGMYQKLNRYNKKETYSFKLIIFGTSLEKAKQNFLSYLTNIFSPFKDCNLIDKENILNNIKLYQGPEKFKTITLLQNTLIK